jgi:hypothetical protein
MTHKLTLTEKTYISICLEKEVRTKDDPLERKWGLFVVNIFAKRKFLPPSSI